MPIFFSSILLADLLAAAEKFSRNKAYEHLKNIAGTIGPRPLGSLQEKAALTYFAEKLAEYGCQVEWQPVTEAKGMMGGISLNTNSFNVIGRLPGKTQQEIVIGAHIDSSTPEIPGANDDGSGVATVLEVARVLSKDSHQATLVFVAFCGEEAGLVGSNSFVEKYPLENVRLMLQLDMTSDESPLILFIDTKKSQSPRWLVSASIDAFHSLGYRNIDYPTFFQSINSSLGGATSDHEPFLKKGIPAIGFVSDVTFPIHTRNDSLEYFKPDGLERSGKLVCELIKKFDQGQPEEKAGHYLLFMIGEKPLFIHPFWISGFILLSLVVGLITLIRLFVIRKVQVDWTADKKIKKSWPKLLLILLAIIIVMFSSLWLMQGLKGQRFPWVVHPGSHLIYGFIFFILGLWVALQILRRWKLRKNSFFFFIRAALYLVVLILIPWLTIGPRLALYPASGLLLLSLACLVPWAWLKALLWLASPYFMFRLLSLPEYQNFLYRTMAMMGFSSIKTFVPFLLAWTVFVLYFVLWTMPFLLGFAAVYRSHSGDLYWLKRFRSPITLIPLGILVVGGAAYLMTIPSYQAPWEQQISITQKLDQENKTYIEIGSSDYLRGIKAAIDSKEETIDIKSCIKKIDLPLEMNWLKESNLSSFEEKDGEKQINVKLQLDFEKQPYTVSLRLKSDKPFKIDESNVKYSHKKKNATIRWAYYPQQTLRPELRVSLPKEAKLEAEINATFLETPLTIIAQAKNKYFVHRAQIKRRITLSK